ncbi:MAG: hypothetical protein HUU35_13390, partial [Armatimonadetes bacterium]|nr:hypothetical protein [Armatimonadota bacterium]
IDLGRRRRRGAPEFVYCANKTLEQIISIVRVIDAAGQNVLCTRVSPELAPKIRRQFEGLVYNERARTLSKINERVEPAGTVAVVSAGTSDLPVAEEAAVTAERRDGGGLTVIARVLDGEVVVAEKATTLRAETARVPLVVTDPKLWWPNDLGEQPLYRVEIELRDGERLLDTWSRRIGLRTLRLDRHPDQWGESFQFSINGLPFFAKGANWIPADAFVTRVTRDDYARLLGDAAAAHMNMLRVWGGGTYERDDFYELCDELGICVWQDFMFACATYPAFDAAFLDNVRAEAEDNVKRLRHHACLALWCGNNELEQGLVADEWTGSAMSWEDYGKLFDQLLPEVVGRLDPERDYWPCSPHTPPPGDRKDFNNPDRGDAHLWSVWHGKQPFEWYRTCTHRFNSEFGFQSFPEPRTVASYTEPADRNITSYVMEHHQRSGIGNATILHYLLSWFRLPTAFDSTLWLSQIVQGMAIKYAVEHWRRAMPRGMGTIYWQLNDNWPVASWSSIDYPGRWKALHYLARRFFAPLLVSGLEDAQNGTVEVHVTSDRLEAVEAEVAWRVTDIAGGTLAEGAQTRRIGPRRNTRVQTLKLGKPLAEHGPRGLLVWLELRVGGELVSSNFVSFARPKHLELLAPDIAVEVHGDGREHHLRLSAAHPALWAWVEVEGAEARLSDSFVHLRPGGSTDLTVTLDRAMTAAELQQRLKVSSLFDTYQ